LNPVVLILAVLIGIFIIFAFSITAIKGFLPVWLHIPTTFLGQLLGVAVGLCAYYSLHVPDKIAPYIATLPQGVQKFAWIGLFLVVTTLFMLIPLRIISRLIPVRCRKQGCGGSAYLIGLHPFTYKCSVCGEVYETKVSQVGRR
jgi:hypothetical protein